MTFNGWSQILFFLLAILAVTPLLGRFMTKVLARERTLLDPVLLPLERGIYRLTGVDEKEEMGWLEYAGSVIAFSLVSMLALYLIQRLQGMLPWNPQGLPNVPSDLAFNTAASFVSNTNWQSYVGETTMSYLTQMVGLSYQNFVSAGSGIAIAIALVRGIARREQLTIGNFWVDFTRANLWLLLPFCLVGSLVLVSQGVVQNLKPYDTVQLVDPFTVSTTDEENQTSTTTVTTQTIAQGPVASSSSSSGAPTAVASSTPTPRIPTRTPLHSPTSSRCSPSSPLRLASRLCSAR